MSQVQVEHPSTDLLPEYHSILLAADSSDHSNQGIQDAVAIARLWNAKITAAHVYAAKLHDMRFRQMEGGLPEQYRQEDELEKQRDVHDDLITRGLSIITDSYLDQVDKTCKKEKLSFARCSLEGKNYRELAREANSGEHDLLIMGAQGLGAIKGSLLGSVCERVSRRSSIDTLIVKNPLQSISNGPVVVAIDGSTFAYGALLRGISLAQQWNVPLHVISAFDPYYHYVAFNRIAEVLSEEAGKVFRFQEQEQLHEDIIDSGLAKIYDGHLSVAKTVADDYAIEIETKLLDGKAWDAILKYLKQVKPSLLIIGKTGIHADDELDIGGNTENLLRLADCAVLVTQFEYQPQLERLADITTSWTVEAEQRMQNVPSFVQNMARSAILRYAQEHGHTVITESIVEAATRQLMPGHASNAIEEIVAAHDAGKLNKSVTPQPMQWSAKAQSLLNNIKDKSIRTNLAMRAEKKARSEDSFTVELEHISAFLEEPEAAPDLHWQAAALARLSQVPEGFMRDTSRQRIEAWAKNNGHYEISLETAEAGLTDSRQAMQKMMQDQEKNTSATSPETTTPKESICPFARRAANNKASYSKDYSNKDHTKIAQEISWDADAEAKLQSIPPGYCRDMTRRAVVSIAANSSMESRVNQIDVAFVEQVLNTFSHGSGGVEETLEWDEDARLRIAKAPDMVRGMLQQQIETWVKNQGGVKVDHLAVDTVKQQWEQQGVFHISPDDSETA